MHARLHSTLVALPVYFDPALIISFHPHPSFPAVSIKYKGPFRSTPKVPSEPKCYGMLEDSLEKLLMDVSKCTCPF